jgi:hypothetical protein
MPEWGHRLAAHPVRTGLRVLIAAAIIAFAAVAARPEVAAAAPPDLSYSCAPAPSDCSAWYQGPVTLSWTWDATTAFPTPDGDCAQRTFTADTTGTKAACEVTDGFLSTKHIVTIRVDATPPAVSAAVPDRLPDHGDWYTHPVTVSFRGSDATSGPVTCDTVTYSGPDGVALPVAGTCRDIAGNVSTATFPLNYDATPPALTDVVATGGEGFTLVRWKASADTARVEVQRQPGPAGPVFTGTGDGYRDSAVVNGVLYTYVVTAFDMAGNAVQGTASAGAIPPAPVLAEGIGDGPGKRPPLLQWKKVKGATYYNVQLYRGVRKVLTAWPTLNRLSLRRQWRYAGRSQTLVGGTYRWYVWPGFGPLAEHRYGRLIDRGVFVMAAR